MSELLHISTEEFLREKIDVSREGLDRIPHLLDEGDLAAAEHEYAVFVRRNLQPDKYFSTGFNPPENAWALPGETDRQIFERLCRGEIMSCGYMHDFGEDGIRWEANPTPNKYAEWTWQLNRHFEFRALGRLYRETGDERVAELFIRLFRSWREQCQCEKDVPGYHTLSWRTIEIGIRLTVNWHYALHAFYRSEAFTDHDICEFFASLWENAWRLRHYHRPVGNWLFMEMSGLYHTGLLYPWLSDAAEWKRYALEKTVGETEKQLYPDGFQVELSTNYHGVVIHNVSAVAAITRAMGEPVPEELTRGLVKAYELYEKLADPGLHTPDLNDGSRQNVAKALAPALLLCPGRDDFRYFVSRRAEGQPPAEKDTVMPYSGIAVLRDSWEADSQWLLFDGGPFGLGHQHEDKLNVLLYAFGKDLLRDTGNYAYDTSRMRAYVLSAYSHNTVLVDGLGQNRRGRYRWHDGDLTKVSDLSVRLGKNADVLRGIYDEGFGPEYTDVKHERMVIKIKSAPTDLGTFYMVIDRLFAADGKPHLYEAHWQLEDVPVSVGSCGGALQTSHERPDYSGKLLKGSRITADYGDGVTLTLLSGENCVIRRGSEQPFVGWRTPNVPAPCVDFAAYGTDVRIVTVLYPSDRGCPITSVEYSSDTADREIKIKTQGGVWICNEEEI